jgi:hypothetical protein
VQFEQTPARGCPGKYLIRQESCHSNRIKAHFFHILSFSLLSGFLAWASRIASQGQ